MGGKVSGLPQFGLTVNFASVAQLVVASDS